MHTTRRLLTILLLILTACLSPGEYDPIQYYDLQADPAVPETNENTGLKVAVRPLDYARAYKQPIVVRNASNQIEYDDFNRWVELPREMITRELVDTLLDTGAFADVAYSTDISGPDLLLQGEVRQFDWVDSKAAVAEMRIDLRNRRSDALLWSGTLRAESPVSGDGAAAFADAMGEAVAEILSTAVAEIVTAAEAYEPATE